MRFSPFASPDSLFTPLCLALCPGDQSLQTASPQWPGLLVGCGQWESSVGDWKVVEERGQGYLCLSRFSHPSTHAPFSLLLKPSHYCYSRSVSHPMLVPWTCSHPCMYPFIKLSSFELFECHLLPARFRRTNAAQSGWQESMNVPSKHMACYAGHQKCASKML